MWRPIGTELGVDVDKLNTIEKDHTNDKDRLHAVIDSANPAPTRETMTKILKSANISNAIAGTCMFMLLSLHPLTHHHVNLDSIVTTNVGWGLHTLWLADVIHQTGVC